MHACLVELFINNAALTVETSWAVHGNNRHFDRYSHATSMICSLLLLLTL